MSQPVENEETQPEAVAEAPPDGQAPATGAPEEAATRPEAAAEPDLEAELRRERERSGGYLEELQRERASFINYRRRTEQEKEELSRAANAGLMFNLLAVLDDFERARANIPQDQLKEPWVEGLLLVGRKLYSTLELAGLKPIEAVGRTFDPRLHEAFAAGPGGDLEPDTVIEEYEKGYMLGDRVLRATKVKVSQ
jgi:molecular chaperone GrpE